ncbi:uncharacterized protein LOC106949503 [Poecilia latipinna]|uniref:uncharacterized protein LOC106949503 n=1 Tax=Poecilia latipinna TaxID=48699 RepID=UPI00072E6026|nr:PREDICTED: uncharacterized protein LOC106949503 [Poecilia latipinna]
MACSSQSASDYIKSARGHLVGQLTSLSVILENLYQQKVLMEEEVSNIEAEKSHFNRTRAILDSVTKKGEEACYRLLRILYETRSRTLPAPHPKNKHSASTKAKRFDLHHWISCFPFRDDDSIYVDYIKGSKPCHRYQAKLKTEAEKFSNNIWRRSENLFEENKKPGLSFYSLVLNTEGTTTPSKVKTFKNKKSNMYRSKKLRTYIPESKPEISPSDLLKHDKNILLVGKPGMGKTALSHEMLRLWSERDKQLDYMFYFDMRELTNIPPTMSLEDLLFNVHCEPDEGKDEILTDMKSHSDNLIIILDGVTDFTSLVVKKFAKKNLPYAKIIITCRPEDEDQDKKDFCPKDWLRVEVKGFSKETISRYLSSVLGEDHRKVLSNVELLTLCHVPMYALMVAASFSSEDSLQPRTVTEIYINIVRFCLQMNSSKIKMKNLNQFIKTKSNEILSLAEAAFNATERKTVNLEELSCEDGCVLSFLKTLDVKVAPTETITLYAFLHYTMQEFFAALWALKSPDKIREVLQQFLTEEKKHMKHLIPFMCRLLNQKSPSLMICLTPAEELKETQQWVTKDLIDTVLSHGSERHVDMLFLCQCLYESQSSEPCISFLDKLNYHIDLSRKNLDPHSCCAVSYVISQSTDRKINLNLQDVTISVQGMRRLRRCLQNVERTGTFRQQLWKIVLLSEGQIDNQSLQMDYEALLNLDGNQIHLPVRGEKQLFERAVRVMQKAPTKVDVCLYQHLWAPRLRGLHEYLVEVLSNISSIRFVFLTNNSEEYRFLVNLYCAAAEREQQTAQKMVELVASVWRFSSVYPPNPFKEDRSRTEFLLRLYSQMKDRETQTGLSLLPSLQSIFQSAPEVWIINLSERKTSVLLEVIKLQPEKKPVMVTNFSHEKSEVGIFLQCLPHISQLWFDIRSSGFGEQAKFLVNLFCAAAKREQQTGKRMLEMLASVCRYETFPSMERFMDYDDEYYDYFDDYDDYHDVAEDQSNFLLDLYSQMKDRETQTGLSLLPSLQSVFQSAPEDWTLKLSQRKTSILLEVMKLQPEKKPVELRDCSHEESEVGIFLQCLPHISQLRFYLWSIDSEEPIRFLLNLFCAAAQRQQQSGEKVVDMLASLFSNGVLVSLRDTYDMDDYPDDQYQSDFLLDLYSQMKDRETQSGLSLLPTLQSVFQSAPPVWFLNLSKRKTSILLEVMKLQPEKKPVNLTDCSHEESEVGIFLQCLPHISQLSFSPWSSAVPEQIKFLVNLFCAAAERETQTGEKMLQMLASVCRYETFPLNKMYIRYYFSNTYDYLDDEDEDHEADHQNNFFLSLYFHLKDRETQTGLSLLPSLQSVFQSAPKVWIINLSKIKTSILLEVMKLQPEKKPVELKRCSHEKSEVGIFLQCLPHISELSLEVKHFKSSEQTKLLVNLFCAAAERETQTGEKMLQVLASVCRYETFPLNKRENLFGVWGIPTQTDFLLDLYSQLKDRETQTGLSLLPSLRSVFQSAPPVWSIDLSERKTSILLEVMKLQPEKKPVKLKHCSHEESEVGIFLQCLPHISQLSFSFDPWSSAVPGQIKFLVNLFCAAAERETQTGEKMLQMLASVCRYETFPFNKRENLSVVWRTPTQTDFLLSLYSQMKDRETQTGLSLLPSLQSVFQSAPPVWIINLSERKTSILLEVMKLQPEKKPVNLTVCSHGESEVRIFLQCLPHISQLSFNPRSSTVSERTRFLVNLFCAAAETEKQTGEKMLQMLASVCRYETLELNVRKVDEEESQNDFLLDLYSQVRDCETRTGLSLLPSVQPVFQSAPSLCITNLSEGKTSILLEVLKLQPEKKPVVMMGASLPKSEVGSFLQGLPHISQIICDSGFFQRVCSFLSERSREEVQQLESLLQQLDFKLFLSGALTSETCSSVGRVLRLCGPKVDLILTGSQMSVGAAAVLFSSTAQLQSLRVCSSLVLFLGQWVSRGRLARSLVLKELSVVSTKPYSSQRVLLKVGSSLASLLRFCKIGRLDLAESGLPAQSLFSLLLHDAPLSLRLSEERLQQLLVLVQEVKDQNLTSSLLNKVGGDLSCCSLSWELLHYLLQEPTAQTITVDLKKNPFLEERAVQLLPFLHRVEIQKWRPSPSLVRTSIRQICRDHSSHLIPGLLRSLGHVINLNCTELDSEDCDALLFILRHSDGVKLKLMWSSMPAGGVQSVLCLLHSVSDLSVDRNLLLSFILCCAASDSQQGAAPELLRTLQHMLDLSGSCCVDLSEEDRTGPVSLTAADCRAVSTVLRHSSRDTQLDLIDCEVEDSVLDLLFPVLDRVRLRVSKTVLVQLLSLLVDSQGDTERRAMSLCRALGGELDLSHSPVDERLCGALVLVLDRSEGLAELDLSHCQLTDQLLLQLSTQLHKVQVLDLSHNHITDASTAGLLQLVSINASIGSVRLSNNNIVNKTPYKDNRKFEIR